jgi:transposase InsO family protein
VAVTCRVLGFSKQGFYRWRACPVTERAAEGKLYLCAMKDVYSGRIVGYSMDARMKSSLAVTALENVVPAHRPAFWKPGRGFAVEVIVDACGLDHDWRYVRR